MQLCILLAVILLYVVLVMLSCSVTQPCIYVMTQGYICLRHTLGMSLLVLKCHFLLVSCSATVVKEREDERRSRGFGFVTFYESKHVEDAIYQLNDSVKFCLMVQSYVREN